jgi:hypothetical protein
MLLGSNRLKTVLVVIDQSGDIIRSSFFILAAADGGKVDPIYG